MKHIIAIQAIYASSAGLTEFHYVVETVGRATPCFRHGTDYILNLLYTGPPAYYAKYEFAQIIHAESRILVLPYHGSL
ncbi:hypothetical protein J2S21_003166 [Peribacillus cavernae]|nr:hypothetical protein [Peribacillus cavernae]